VSYVSESQNMMSIIAHIKSFFSSIKWDQLEEQSSMKDNDALHNQPLT